ncbi:MAG: 16S rRNA (guanine(966)-N(2))-methyltransferase RsmD [Deltaproteobacteria bacterium]
MSLRVISGKAKGLRLKTIKSLQTRPTADRIKESLFSIIAPLLHKAIVLDLFAGTGALGIEALSRGADFAVFIDNSRESINVIKENINHTGFEQNTEVYLNDYDGAIKLLAKRDKKYDIVFLDPPYGKGLEIKAADSIIKNNLLSNKGIIIIETEEVLENRLVGVTKVDERSYGRTKLSFFEREKKD